MKVLRPIVAVLLVGLLVQHTIADISLKLKNKSYIPPAIKKFAVQEELRNRESNQQQQQQHQQQTFHEDNYANLRYQIFEVHNHYEPPAGNIQPQQQPQQHEERIRIQHINAPADFPFDDPKLDATYLSLDSDNKQFIVKHETSATDSNNNPTNSVPGPLSTNYQQKFPASIKAKEYLSPKQNYQTLQNPISRQNLQDSTIINNFNTQQKNKQFSQPQQNSFNGIKRHGNQQIVPKLNTILNKKYLPSNPTKPEFTGRNHVQNEFQKSFKGTDYIPPLNGNNKKSSFKRPVNLVPHQSGLIEEQQQTFFGQNTPFKGPNYLPPHHQGLLNSPPATFGQHAQFKGPDYLPPNHYSLNRQQQTSFQSNKAFKGPEYLPPQKGNFAQQQSASLSQNIAYKGPDYLPPQRKRQNQNDISNIKTLSYLPPDYDHEKPSNSEQAIAELHTLPEQSQQQYKQEKPVGTQIQVTGHQKTNFVIYNSAKQRHPPQSVSSQQTSGYLPPGYDFQNPGNLQQPINEFNNQEPQLQSQIPLPAGYDFQKPENSDEAITQLHSRDYFVAKQSPVSNQKPENLGKAKTQLHSQDYFAAKQSHISNPINSQEYLPPGYDFQKPKNSEQAINELPSIGTHGQQPSGSASVNTGGQSYNVPAYLPRGYDFQKLDETSPAINQLPNHLHDYRVETQAEQHAQSYNQAQLSQQAQTHQSHSRVQSQQDAQQIGHIFKGAAYLPPVASVAAINHQLNQPSAKAFKGLRYLPPIASPRRESTNYQAPEYLPPAPSSLRQINQPLLTEIKGPDYLPPITAPQVFPSESYQANNQQTYQQPQLQRPAYLPPTVAAPSRPIHATNMYPLSSYMTTVKPYERYGSARKPFPEYGLPPTTDANDNISSMYRGLASMPQYYAPALTYEKNAVNTQTSNSYKPTQYHDTSASKQKTRQNSMLKELPQTITEGYSGSLGSADTKGLQTTRTKPASTKIRTVQIINTTVVKTLKVLESLDHAGVKTIKILGLSHEEPMGNHSVVKIVSGSHGQAEQTVKIFNDQQDATTSFDQSQEASRSSYLPSRNKRSHSKNKSKAKSRHSI